MQPRHHRADWNVQCGCDLLVGHLLHVAEQNHFLIRLRNLAERAEYVLVGQLLWYRWDEGQRLREPLLDRSRVTGFPVLSAAAIRTKVLQDRRQPGAAIGARRVAMKRLKRLRQRILDEIFGGRAIAFEPHREAEQTVDVRQSLGFKGLPRRFVRHAPHSWSEYREGGFLFRRTEPPRRRRKLNL